MKKYLLLLCLTPFTTYAANMCVKNDAVLIVLDPNIAPTSTDYDNNAHTWTATFSYGTIRGLSGCALASQIGGTALGITSNPQSRVDINGTPTAGAECACKMLFPVESLWVNSYYLVSSAACGTICAQYCASQFSTQPVVRRAIFGNVIP